MNRSPDVLVIGAGAAGLSAALWARSLDLSVRVLEGAPMAGGQLHAIHFHPDNLAGYATGDGPALAATFGTQLEESGAELHLDTLAVSLESDGLPAVVRTSAGATHEAGAVVIATGVRRRRLGVPGERELEGRGVSYSATRDRDAFAGCPVVVAGGGDAAYENALLLAEVECRVTLVVRDMPRARAEFRSRVANDRRISVRPGTRVTAVVGRERLEAVRLEGPDGARDEPFDGIVIKVGMLPNTEWCAAAVALDGEGYVVVDDRQRTSRTRTWAAGDVARPARPGLAFALGQGAAAAAEIRRELRGD